MSETNNIIENDIPPGGNPIQILNDNDVLCGRGGRIAQHPGNLYFRDLVRKYRSTYLSKSTKKLDKVKIASKIVQTIRTMDPPGRFLKEQEREEEVDVREGSGLTTTNSYWIEIGDDKARKKAGQAMREKLDERGRKERKQSRMQEQQQQQQQEQQMDMMISTFASTSYPSTISTSSPSQNSTTATTTQQPTSPSRYDAYHNLQESSTFPVMLDNSNSRRHSSFTSYRHPQNNHSNHQQMIMSPPTTTNTNNNDSSFLHVPMVSRSDDSNRSASLGQTLRDSYRNSSMSTTSFNNTSYSNTSYSNTQYSNTSFRQNESSDIITNTDLEPMDYLVRENSTTSNSNNTSNWNDSWDQGINMDDFPLVDTRSSRTKPVLARTESARRRQFHMMKDESSYLPSSSEIVSSSGNHGLSLAGSSSSSSSNDNTANGYKLSQQFNESELMKGSLVSMDMHSSSSSSGISFSGVGGGGVGSEEEEMMISKKSMSSCSGGSSGGGSGGELKKSMNMMETTMSMNDMRMDSLMTSLTSLIMSAD